MEQTKQLNMTAMSDKTNSNTTARKKSLHGNIRWQ